MHADDRHHSLRRDGLRRGPIRRRSERHPRLGMERQLVAVADRDELEVEPSRFGLPENERTFQEGEAWLTPVGETPQTADDLVVRAGDDLWLARGGVDPRDPELPHFALAAAAVAERVSERVQDRLVGGTEQQFLREPKALRPVEDPLVAAMRGNTALDSCHLGLDPQRPANRFAVALGHGLLGVVFALVLLRLLVEAMAHPGVAAHYLPVARHAHALGDAFAGLELRHWSLTPSARRRRRRRRQRPAGSAPGS